MNFKRSRGLTLLEVMITCVILVLILGTILASLMAAQNAYTAGTRLSAGQSNARRAMNEVAGELRLADPTSVIITTEPGGSERLDFNMNIDFQNGAAVFSVDPVVYSFQYDIGELDNGIDDDGDGLVDEGVLVRTEGPASRQLCPNLKEDGFEIFQGVGNQYTINLTVQSTDDKRRVLDSTVSTSITLRHP